MAPSRRSRAASWMNWKAFLWGRPRLPRMPRCRAKSLVMLGTILWLPACRPRADLPLLVPHQRQPRRESRSRWWREGKAPKTTSCLFTTILQAQIQWTPFSTKCKPAGACLHRRKPPQTFPPTARCRWAACILDPSRSSVSSNSVSSNSSSTKGTNRVPTPSTRSSKSCGIALHRYDSCLCSLPRLFVNSASNGLGRRTEACVWGGSETRRLDISWCSCRSRCWRSHRDI
mmetsp:Transcript_12665/g.35382  ORF Transcript_12665/g.35382 Transcript_12665/m.35382 type:complete len:230 (-) Transcript_12665:104-793(-)